MLKVLLTKRRQNSDHIVPKCVKNVVMRLQGKVTLQCIQILISVHVGSMWQPGIVNLNHSHVIYHEQKFPVSYEKSVYMCKKLMSMKLLRDVTYEAIRNMFTPESSVQMFRLWVRSNSDRKPSITSEISLHWPKCSVSRMWLWSKPERAHQNAAEVCSCVIILFWIESLFNSTTCKPMYLTGSLAT